MNSAIERLNHLPESEAEAELLACCGSTEWARRMAQARPFGKNRQNAAQELFDAADRIWWGLTPDDWLEAFSRHPKIGEKKAAKPGSSEERRWSKEEQAGVRGAAQDTLALVEANRAYENHFGYIFIVCATGKTTEEILALIRQRLQNDPGAELRIAAEEQRRITHLRLKKLLGIPQK